ncbi:uncharacterized protein VTP21DRAFT_2785 [Calcarisporiella thermophila]|uniref:uncharacterized protein n=1 Tax=Calcarisporiella thermophila TaxID=911321 RepID=UPI0037440E0E
MPLQSLVKTSSELISTRPNKLPGIVANIGLRTSVHLSPELDIQDKPLNNVFEFDMASEIRPRNPNVKRSFVVWPPCHSGWRKVPIGLLAPARPQPLSLWRQVRATRSLPDGALAIPSRGDPSDA